MNTQDQIEQTIIELAPLLAEVIELNLAEGGVEVVSKEESFFSETRSAAAAYGLTTSDKLQANAERHFKETGGHNIPAFFLADEWDSLVEHTQPSATLEADNMLSNMQKAAYLLTAQKARIIGRFEGIPEGLYIPVPYLVPSVDGVHMIETADGKRAMRRGVFGYSPTATADDYIPFAAFAPFVGTVTGMLELQKHLIDAHHNWDRGTAAAKGYK